MTAEEKAKLTAEYWKRLKEAIRECDRALKTCDTEIHMAAVRRCTDIQMEAQALGLDVREPPHPGFAKLNKPGSRAYLKAKFESPPGEFTITEEEFLKKIA